MRTELRSLLPIRLCSVLATSAVLARGARAQEAPVEPAPPPPSPSVESKPEEVALAVALVAVGVLVYAAAIDAAGCDDHRTAAALFFYAGALGTVSSTQTGRGLIAAVAGHLAIGTYILVNDNSSGTRHWVTGIGTLLMFTASVIDSDIEKRAAEKPPPEPITFRFSGTQAALAFRF